MKQIRGNYSKGCSLSNCGDYQTVKPGEHLSTVAVEISRLSQATPKFSVELLVNKLDLTDGYALLVQPGDGGNSETILPIQKAHGAIRAFVPPAEAGAYLVFVLALRAPDVPDPGKLGSLVTVRPLECGPRPEGL